METKQRRSLIPLCFASIYSTSAESKSLWGATRKLQFRELTKSEAISRKDLNVLLIKRVFYSMLLFGHMKPAKEFFIHEMKTV